MPGTIGNVNFELLLPLSFATLPPDLSWEPLLADYYNDVPLQGKPDTYGDLQSLLDGVFISDAAIEALATRAINDAEHAIGLPS
ncbi:hypothetical protein HDU93_006236, partial [Gonapodya sp. JEL0774]